MWLQMFLAGILVDQYELDYSGLLTTANRTEYHERLADKLRSHHLQEITLCRQEPTFLISGQPSRVNQKEVASRYLCLTDEEFVAESKKEFKDESWVKK